MKRCVVLLAVPWVACASPSGGADSWTEESAYKAYVQAVDLRMQGDLRGSNDQLLALAAEASDTRAGHMARIRLTGSADLMAMLAMLGAVSAGAVDTFEGYQNKAKQSEAKLELQSLKQQLEAHHAQFDTYRGAMEGVVPAGAYGIAFSDRRKLLPDDLETREQFAEIQDMLDLYGAQPFLSRSGYRVIAFANLDEDGDLDVWMLDSQAAEPTHLVDDLP